MGSGAKAERMALGASIAEKRSYLATLQAEKEDVSGIFGSQQDKIKTLVDVMASAGKADQPVFVTQPGRLERKADLTVPIVIVIITYFFLSR